jgi:hypothetical protein
VLDERKHGFVICVTSRAAYANPRNKQEQLELHQEAAISEGRISEHPELPLLTLHNLPRTREEK